MAEKPERPHIKRIPIPTNLSSGVTVITEPKKVEGIKLGPNRKNQAHSAERREVRKKLYKDNFNNFYFDAFNSVKRNQNDLSALRSQVSIKKLIFINFQSFIFVFQKRYQYRPKEKDNFQFGYAEPETRTYENIYGYQRKYPNTRDRIFNLDNPNNKGNKEKVQKWKSKPCNNDYDKVTEEARKNAFVRYYFENNVSQW